MTIDASELIRKALTEAGLSQSTLAERFGTTRVAALADIIRSKESANRPKDHATLPILRALQEEIGKG